jgi:predicted component of type VI protein secretion system
LPKITITEGPGAGKEYEVDEAVILGRLDSNDIPVHDTKASREHAKIYKQGSVFSIVDLNSSNGTFVNGKKITKQALSSGDEITIGQVSLRFEDPEAEAAKQAAVSGRKTLDDAFGKPEKKPEGDAGKQPEIVMAGHKPLQYSRVKPGTPILGFDLDQMSDTARLIVYIALIAVFAGLMWLAYTLVSV